MPPPTLGEHRLAKLSPDDLERLYAERLASALAPQTVVHIHRMLHKALKRAARQGIVAGNVAALVDPPRVAKEELRTLSPDEARRFLDATRSDRFHALFVLALSNGMRQGELLALRWPQVDLDAGRIQVSTGLARTEHGRDIAETKTHRSKRPVVLSEESMRALQRHRLRQNEGRLAAGPDWEDNDLVFPNQNGRPMNPSNLIRRNLRPTLERAGLPKIRIHDLRHSAATLALQAGVDPKVVSEMLGHASVQLTLDRYSHVNESLMEDAAERMGRILE